MAKQLIEYAANVHGFKAGDVVEVDSTDPDVKGAIEGGYAKVVTGVEPNVEVDASDDKAEKAAKAEKASKS